MEVPGSFIAQAVTCSSYVYQTGPDVSHPSMLFHPFVAGPRLHCFPIDSHRSCQSATVLPKTFSSSCPWLPRSLGIFASQSAVTSAVGASFTATLANSDGGNGKESMKRHPSTCDWDMQNPDFHGGRSMSQIERVDRRVEGGGSPMASVGVEYAGSAAEFLLY